MFPSYIDKERLDRDVEYRKQKLQEVFDELQRLRIENDKLSQEDGLIQGEILLGEIRKIEKGLIELKENVEDFD